MRSILVLDSRVADCGALTRDLRSGTRVVLLEPHEDGIAQIARALGGERDLAALHLVSHGADGMLVLGGTTLKSSNLDDYENELASIGASLCDTGDILLYGCEVAKGREGRAFIDALSRAAGAHVAASSTPVGSAALGGSWELEARTGPVAVGVFLGKAAQAAYAHTLPVSNIDLSSLDGTNGFKLSGPAGGDNSGRSVSGAGDVNGDGVDDLIVGAPYADPNGALSSGASYVVFGRASGFALNLNLATLDGLSGFRLSGVAANDFSGRSVSGAGDVNGDGLDDLIVGALGADPNAEFSGASYVVFGRASGFASDLNLSALDGTNGFRLSGAADGDYSGSSVSAAGDVNGDGFDDVIVGAYRADPNGSGSGASYVVFGKASGYASNLELSALDGANGFKLAGASAGDQSGFSVSAAGDVNGDGFDDLIVGADYADPNGGYSGASYVVFGQGSGFASNLNLSSLDGSNGFRLSGVAANDRSGISVSSAGDVNGDGFDDLIVGASAASPNGGASGASYVVFGKATGFASNLDLSALDGTNGFRLSGVAAVDQSGISVSAAGDVNGDGFDDLIVGAIGADPNGNSYAGASYVVFGQATGFAANLDLSALDGANGFRLSGVAAGDYAGRSVSAAGDVNGDGFDDLIVGAVGVDSIYGSSSGASYVVYGGNFNGAVTHLGLDEADLLTGNALAEVFVSGQGNDTMVGGGGADVFNAGAGDDRIVVANLSFRGIDGGSGVDTLALAGSGQTLDLTTLANNRIDGIEVIDLTGSGNNTLRLNAADLLDLSDSTNTLRVDGNGGDRVIGLEDWVSAGTTTINSQSYAVYTRGAATLQIDADVGFALPNIQLSSLNGTNGFRLSGEMVGDYSGRSVSNAGDVNGDGFDDLIIGADRADPNGGSSGASYVVFGGSPGFASNLNISSLDGCNGFRLSGAAGGDISGYSVSGAGDVNGDGFADLIVGARFADPNGINYAGASYVVFGQASGFAPNLNLAALDGSSGFRLAGVVVFDFSGSSVSAAGDVNGDGFDDLIVGATGADPNGNFSGASYVVFGQASGFAPNLDFSALDGANGFRLSGVAAYDQSGRSVSAAGDVNGDGFDDLIVGAIGAAPNGGYSGASYVVFGKASGYASNLDLSALDGSNGFRLSGVAASDRTGVSVGNAGDVNGDGFDDLIVGAYWADPNGSYSGASYVVFGHGSGFASNVELSALNGANGFRLSGVTAEDRSGISVSGAGDVNGDGFDDLVVGAHFADPNYAGASYVVFGRSSGFSSNLDLSALDGMNGFQLAGAAAFDRSGISVSGAGDVNGDGFDDLIVGAYAASPNGTYSGASDVVYGGNFTGAVTHLGTAGADLLAGSALAETFASGQGNDTVTGGGGADVFNAGAGDDRIVLASPDFALVDGGSGLDTLALSGSGQTLDLTTLANNRIGGVEVIDLTGSGNNTLKLGALDLLDLSDSTNTLRVDGNGGDRVIGFEDWTSAGTTTIDGQAYTVYTRGAATLQIDADVGFALPNIQLSSLNGTNGFRLSGVVAGDRSGRAVSDAGDVNGDGFADLIVGADRADPNGYSTGASYVVFGQASGFASNLNLSALDGANGFRLSGVAASDFSGRSVSAAGDVNGDGFDDLVVGAYRADPNGTQSGASYVVFGKASGFASNLNLSVLDGASGFRLSGNAAYDYSGIAVGNAGDVNGDGFDDLIVGANRADPNGSSSGASYVVFGSSSGFASNLNLSGLDGVNGFRLSGVTGGDQSGVSVNDAGDVNGDGFDDLIVGAHSADPNGSNSGASYVVFGKASGFASNLNLSGLDGTNGFRLSGAAGADQSGYSVSGAGDVNGDGFDDLVVGAVFADPNGSASGASYVVFGKASGFASNLNLSALDGTNGFRLSGVAAGDESGVSVSAAGDVNGDGFDDLIVGAVLADPNGNYSGANYVVFGKSSGFAANLDLSALDGMNGFRLAGVAASDYSGRSVRGVGDVNGDGFDDLMVGADGADPNGSQSGASYVIYGGNFNGAVTHLGGAGADTLAGTAGADALVGGQGNDTLLAGGGNDALRGGAGDDWLDGGAGTDRMNGGSGNDTYVIDSLSDRIEEASAGGNDTVRTSLVFSLQNRHELENLILLGSANLNAVGNDENNVLGSNAGNNLLDGGTGSDTASYVEAANAVEVNLLLIGPQATGAGDDTLLGIENLTGSSFDDTLVGDGGANVLDGGAGHDVLIGLAGDDLYRVDSLADLVVEDADEGYDTVQSKVSYSLSNDVEQLILTGTSNLSGLGSATDNAITGNAGGNVLKGGAGQDSLDGGNGNDNLAGNEGNDTLLGGEGDDTLGGGKDNDSLMGGNGHDSLTGLLGNDTLSGDLGFDTLDGGEGNDSLLGGLQKDELFGGNGDDTLAGGNGFDTIDGGAGNDSLRGAIGTDVLTGGSGADRFVFATVLDGVLNIDTLTDFMSGTDVIEISAAIFTAYTGQIGNTVGLSANLTYASGTGVLQYDADGAGGGAGVTFAILGTSIHPAVGSDFFITA